MSENESYRITTKGRVLVELAGAGLAAEKARAALASGELGRWAAVALALDEAAEAAVDLVSDHEKAGEFDDLLMLWRSAAKNPKARIARPRSGGRAGEWET